MCFLRKTFILTALGFIFLLGRSGFASDIPQTYKELAAALKKASCQAEQRRLKAQLARCMVDQLEDEKLPAHEHKKIHDEAVSICSDLQLGAMDLWFSEGIINWGRLLVLDGKYQQASVMLDAQVELMRLVEKKLAEQKLSVSAWSPVAGCRYVRGCALGAERLQVEGEKEQVQLAALALKEFSHVTMQYPDSYWSERARERALVLRAFLQEHGFSIRLNAGKNRGALLVGQFKHGARMVAEARYEDALLYFLEVLRSDPDTEGAPFALRYMVDCFLQLNREQEAAMVTEYLCERFVQNPKTADALRSIAGCYAAKKKMRTSDQIYATYLELFPKDQHVVEVLNYLGWKAYRAKNFSDAEAYFSQSVTRSPDAKIVRACASSAWKMKDIDRALLHYQALEKILLRNREEEGLVAESLLWQSRCLQEDPEAALACLERILQTYPTTACIPQVLAEKAGVLLVLERADDAFAVLVQLESKRGAANSAERVWKKMLASVLERGRLDLVEEVIDQLSDGEQLYAMDVLKSAGDLLLQQKKYALAERAYTTSMHSANRLLACQSMVGCAAAQDGAGKHTLALEMVRCGYAHACSKKIKTDARLLEARILVVLGQLAEAVEAFNEVLASRSDYTITAELAAILPTAEEKLLAYQRIVVLADPEDVALQPLIAESILATLPLCVELERWQIAADNCAQFIAEFPEHDRSAEVLRFQQEVSHASL